MRPMLTIGAGWRRGGPERWVAVAVLLALSCPAVGTGPDPSVAAIAVGTGPDPSISAIEVVPPEIMVDATEAGTLALTAQLWSGPATNRKSITPSVGPALGWKLNPAQPWLTILSQDGYRVTLKIQPTASSSAPVVVEASTGTWSAESRVVPVTSTDFDVVEARPTDGIPDAVVSRGMPDAIGATCAVSLSAFVRTAKLSKLVGACDPGEPTWGVAVLDATRAMALLPAGWTPQADTADANSVQRPMLSLPVSLRIVIGGTGNLDSLRTVAKAIALGDFQAATATLAENRVGVALEVVDTLVVATSDELIEVADCITGDALTPAGDRSGMLHVIYVNSMGGARGFTCAGTKNAPQPTIFIAWESEEPSTLVHETGHVLGLTLPGWGHSDGVAGLDATNVMRSGNSDQDPAGRYRLTVGQAFRMNADSGSWLSRARDTLGSPVREADAPRLPCQCGGKDPEGVCPRLSDDIASRSGSASGYNDWDCYDLLRLPATDPGERPVGMLAGVRWRTPVDRCAAVASDQRADHWDTNYLQFVNFTRPGDCRAWAAVFFREHSPLYRDLTEARDLPWSDAADEWEINTELNTIAAADLPRLPVSVQLYYPTGATAKARVDADTAELIKVYGEDNRAGIVLVFTRNPGAACPVVTGTTTTFTVCYGSQQSQPTPANGEIKVSMTAATPFTVSHLLGQALGLSPLTPAEANEPAFAANVMQFAPGKRGDRLTLGQVFRLHVRRGWGPATCDPQGACPPLNLDITP